MQFGFHFSGVLLIRSIVAVNGTLLSIRRSFILVHLSAACVEPTPMSAEQSLSIDVF